MVSLNDVLLAMSNIPVDDPIAEIWGRGLQGGSKIIEYTGALPITISANGNVLLDYRIYGASGGVGETTENLFDYNATDANNGYAPNSYVSADGEITSGVGNWFISEYIAVRGAANYYLKFDTGGFNDRGIAFYDSNKNYISGINYRYDIANLSFSTPSNAKFVRISIRTSVMKKTMLVEGSTAPANYVPYGYKLPMTVSDRNTVQNVPVCINENQLDAGEYVSYGEQKVYRRTENLLNSKITGVAQKVKIEPNTEYVLSRYAELGGNKIYWGVYDESNVPLYSKVYMQSDAAMRVPPFNNASYISITIPEIAYDSVSIVKGTFINRNTAVPETYTPYVLPTDPPVPFPDIPIIKGETIIDYDGTPKPSQMYIKYKGKE